MKVGAKLLVSALIVGNAAQSTSAQADGGQSGLCRAKETEYFACKVDNGGWLSVCGETARTLQIRSGTAQKVAFVFPKQPAEVPSSFLYGYYSRYRVNHYTVTIRHKAVADGRLYLYYDDSEDPLALQQSMDRGSFGFEIEWLDKKKVEITCSDAPTIDRVRELEGLLPHDDD